MGKQKIMSNNYLLFLGVTAAVPCPPGTIRNYTHGTSIGDCHPCNGGKFCNSSAATEPTGVCRERYYCPSFADIDDPQPSEFLCPRGFYCLEDTADPIGCEPGTYQENVGATSCLTCPMGYYCPQNTSTPLDCPAYSYCPDGTASPLLCLNGTYTDSNVTNLEKAGDCTDCPAGNVNFNSSVISLVMATPLKIAFL